MVVAISAGAKLNLVKPASPCESGRLYMLEKCVLSSLPLELYFVFFFSFQLFFGYKQLAVRVSSAVASKDLLLWCCVGLSHCNTFLLQRMGSRIHASRCWSSWGSRAQACSGLVVCSTGSSWTRDRTLPSCAGLATTEPPKEAPLLEF